MKQNDLGKSLESTALFATWNANTDEVAQKDAKKRQKQLSY